MDEEKKVEQKRELFMIEKLLATVDFPEWQKKAFLQFTGWRQGKSVEKKQFDTALNNFIRQYGGRK
ncbi:hypothetical protein [Thermospira aquatica]|uniref:Uncharacterized protein n=1 Tax=Thermospira aquatica TaxID=2828656 RepID=A0AAX3BEQ5_9SPIR|nr:hypothetical protein [Thermospira aquatica]URA10539.1 hypothetical protein KDW03_01685 [Thermospira aquatica]